MSPDLDPDQLAAIVRAAVHEALREAPAPAYLTRRQACAYLNVSMATLERAAFHGGGPAFIKLGKTVRYAIIELDRWAKAREQTRISVGEEEAEL
jgi:excisionase family DNA binding protein